MTTYDCSQPLESGMPVYPGDDPVTVREDRTVAEDGSHLQALELTTHVGTHVDAPAHKIPEGPTLSAFEVSTFAFSARVLDCTPCADRQRLTRAVLPASLREDGPPEDLDLLVFATGWSDHWGTERYRDSPYLGADLAAWCADCGLHVGVDTFSPDPVPSADPTREAAEEPTDQPAHAALCGAGRLILENLRGLERLPERVTLAAYPLALADADGSPVRAVARPRGDPGRG